VSLVAVLRDRLYCRVERSVLTVINEYVMLCYACTHVSTQLCYRWVVICLHRTAALHRLLPADRLDSTIKKFMACSTCQSMSRTARVLI